jgi:parallel beta-helix repeat protein
MIYTALVVLALAQPGNTNVITVAADHTRIDHSCVVRIAPDAVIADADGAGVLQIDADGVTVEFEKGSVLRGAKTGTGPGETPWDALAGCGVRINGHKNVTLKNVEVAGFKVGVRATSADGLKIENANIHDCFRQHLRSTPQAEDGADWLWPHANDKQEWASNYGAGVCVENSKNVTVHDLTVRRGQNGLILDRVDHASIYDNDCSFLSGWGLAMWRSCDNTIARNAFDFCVRGYSEGVYNRGQDSAGILCFEQCSRNTFNENSVTHGGDGFFGFAGKEALGETPPKDPKFDYAKAGCNDNNIINNDFSYCPAHGLELTFSHGNRIIGNRFAENAICGIWGGYSTHTLIEGNTFEGNGGMAYGLERGGINIEHGSANQILRNTFTNNRCGVHLWWDDNAKLLESPSVKDHGGGLVSDNVIAGNTFTIDSSHPFKGARDTGPLVVLQLRDAGQGHVKHTVYSGNKVSLSDPRAKELDVCAGCEPATAEPASQADDPHAKPSVGKSNPVGARESLRGRAAIIMDEWGPWDHASPLVRRILALDSDVYEVFGAKDVEYHSMSGGTQIGGEEATPPATAKFSVRPAFDIVPYKIDLKLDGQHQTVAGTLTQSKWEMLVFPWTKDPRTDHKGWLDESQANGVPLTWNGRLDLPLSHGGPKGIKEWAEDKDKLPGPDHYGIIASTYLRIPKGKWRITTLSDDGIKVEVLWPRRDGNLRKTVIDDYTLHPLTQDSGEFTIEQWMKDVPEEIQIRVEYFQIEGGATLHLEFSPVE